MKTDIGAAPELAKLVDLVEELCDAVDAEAADVGGTRGSLTILREIGPLVAPAKSAIRPTSEPRAGGDASPFVFSYTNWRGETALRIVQPLAVVFGSTEWHPEPQWLLQAIDLEKGAVRDFAMKDMVPPADAGAAMIGRSIAETITLEPRLKDWKPSKRGYGALLVDLLDQRDQAFNAGVEAAAATLDGSIENLSSIHEGGLKEYLREARDFILAEKIDVSIVEPQAEVVTGEAGKNAFCCPRQNGKNGPQRFIVRYEDAEVREAVFDNEDEARAFWTQANQNWNCHLFGTLPLATRPAASGDGGEVERLRRGATEAMIEAGLRVDMSGEDERAVLHNIWNAMQAAALAFPQAAPSPTDFLAQLVDYAETIAWQAGVGSLETAGQMVSYLADRPHLLPSFMDGTLSAIDTDMMDHHAGRLTWHGRDGKVYAPDPTKVRPIPTEVR